METDLELADGIPDFLTGGLKPSDGLAGRPYPPRKVAIVFQLRYADKARNHTSQLVIANCHDPVPRITVARKMPEGRLGSNVSTFACGTTECAVWRIGACSKA